MTPKRNPGRPPLPKRVQRVSVPLRLPRWLVEVIDAQAEPRSVVIERAVRMLLVGASR